MHPQMDTMIPCNPAPTTSLKTGTESNLDRGGGSTNAALHQFYSAHWQPIEKRKSDHNIKGILGSMLSWGIFAWEMAGNASKTAPRYEIYQFILTQMTRIMSMSYYGRKSFSFSPHLVT